MTRRADVRAAVAVLLTLAGAIAGQVLGAGPAHADMQCTTTYSGDISYTLCRYFNPWQHATMTQCSPYGCMTRGD